MGTLAEAGRAWDERLALGGHGGRERWSGDEGARGRRAGRLAPAGAAGGEEAADEVEGREGEVEWSREARRNLEEVEEEEVEEEVMGGRGERELGEEDGEEGEGMDNAREEVRGGEGSGEGSGEGREDAEEEGLSTTAGSSIFGMRLRAVIPVLVSVCAHRVEYRIRAHYKWRSQVVMRVLFARMHVCYQDCVCA